MRCATTLKVLGSECDRGELRSLEELVEDASDRQGRNRKTENMEHTLIGNNVDQKKRRAPGNLSMCGSAATIRSTPEDAASYDHLSVYMCSDSCALL